MHLHLDSVVAWTGSSIPVKMSEKLLVTYCLVLNYIRYVKICFSDTRLTCVVSSGMSRSLESVLSGHPARGQTPGAVRVDQHGRLLPPVMESNSVMMPRDPRRMSEASVNPPPPRPPLPNLKHLHIKAQKKPPMYPASATSWMPQFPAQKPAQTQPSQGAATGSNLIKMSQMNRSTSQLNEDSRERDRTREQEKLQSQNLVTQVKPRHVSESTSC